MAYHENHTNHLNDIINLIHTGQIFNENGALSKFLIYIKFVQEIGTYDSTQWKVEWRNKVWALGEEFKKINPQRFIAIIDNEISNQNHINIEVLDFIKSEIIFNYLPEIECKKQLEKLIELYPLNPEFRHTLGHFYSRELKYLKAINEYKLALKIEPKNNSYLKSLFSVENDYLNNLIQIKEFKTGLEYSKLVYDEAFYKEKSIIYHNSIVGFYSRFSDHLLFQKSLKNLETDFRDKMNEELQSERKRIIEVLGFFSAIVAFILSTVSIGKNFSFTEAVYFIACLGIVLILFASSISILFSKQQQDLLKDIKFWIMIIGLASLLLFIIMCGSISPISLL